MQQNTGHLHLVVEVPGDRARDLHLSVKEVFEGALILGIDVCVNGSTVDDHAKIASWNWRSRVRHKIGGADQGMHSDELAIGLSADHLLEGGLDGLGQCSVTDDGDIPAIYIRPEAFMGGSTHQDAIAGNEFRICGGVHINGYVAILHKEIFVV